VPGFSCGHISLVYRYLKPRCRCIEGSNTIPTMESHQHNASAPALIIARQWYETESS